MSKLAKFPIVACCVVAAVAAVTWQIVDKSEVRPALISNLYMQANSEVPDDAESLQDSSQSRRVVTMDVANHNIKGKVTLSNGEEIIVKWREMTLERVEVDPPYAQQYDHLVKLAENGSAEAAYSLWQILEGCRYGFSDSSAYDAAMQQLNLTHKIKMPDSDEEILLTNPQAVAGWQKQLPILFEQCEGITLERKEKAIHWLTLAADAGHSYAKIQLSRATSDYAIGVSLDQTRWESGDALALKDLATRYYQSYQSGDNPENKVRFYAALYAHSQIAFAQFSLDDFGDFREHVELELDIATQQLLPHELQEAKALADKILRDNQNCCFRL